MSTSSPTVNMWWAHTIKPRIPIEIIAYIIPRYPKGCCFPVRAVTMWEIIPKPGRISIYTSGCPKNQNKCWYRMGSPPPVGSKNVVFMFRSVRSMVMAPARTGRDSRSKIVVRRIDHTNRGVRSIASPGARILIMVVIKFIEAIMEEAPAKCKEKIARSTQPPL